jgi:hypothetical protein
MILDLIFGIITIQTVIKFYSKTPLRQLLVWHNYWLFYNESLFNVSYSEEQIALKI